MPAIPLAKPRDQGGGVLSDSLAHSQEVKTWAEHLGKKCVLELVLAKDEKGPFSVSEDDCARLMRKIGLNLGAGSVVEGVQICPSG